MRSWRRSTGTRRVPLYALFVLAALPPVETGGDLAAPPRAIAPLEGTVEGRVGFTWKASERIRPSVRQLGAEPLRRPASGRGIVYLEAAGLEALEGAPPRARLDQRDETFVPHVLPIRAGTVVDFPNSDDVYHNVFSLSKTRRFDLGRYPRGQTRSVRFERPGVVRVFCEIHSHMSAFVVVLPHDLFAPIEPDGSYRIDGVPAGTYRVVVWSEGDEVARREVEVDQGESVRVDFDRQSR